MENNPGIWSENISTYIDEISVVNNTWRINVWERKLISGQYFINNTKIQK